jgi:tricarballylate dehydrogenase
MTHLDADVIVVGCGNAALCAAIAAREKGADVLVIERSPKQQKGGNSFFSGGWMRFTFDSAQDLGDALPELATDGKQDFDVIPYTTSHYYDEIAELTEYRADPTLTLLLVKKSRETIKWMHDKGVRFNWTFGRQNPKVNGRYQVSGGNIAVSGGGAGLIEKLVDAAESIGVRFLYETRAIALLGEAGHKVNGIRALKSNGDSIELLSKSVVLASGGFGASAEKRARFLGPGWDLAKVRGSVSNTGDGIDMALNFGAQSFGHWSGAHSVCWDATTPKSGDRNSGNEFSRNSYPLGLLVNRNAERFLDEGVDFGSNTYGKYGSNIISQPGSIAYQIFDSQVIDYLDANYSGRMVSKVVANTVEELGEKLGIDGKVLKANVDNYNSATNSQDKFDPNALDGKKTSNLNPPKSNWANPIIQAPFYGFTVTTGLTFTFGGVRVDESARILSVDEKPISGLYAAGEMLGGIFYYTSPSGGGLMAGSVYGRIAGEYAAS